MLKAARAVARQLVGVARQLVGVAHQLVEAALSKVQVPGPRELGLWVRQRLRVEKAEDTPAAGECRGRPRAMGRRQSLEEAALLERGPGRQARVRNRRETKDRGQAAPVGYVSETGGGECAVRVFIEGGKKSMWRA